MLITREWFGLATRNFDSSLRLLICMFESNFGGNWSWDFGFMTQKPPRKFGVKSGFIQKRLLVRQKIFHTGICLKLPFYPH